MPKNVNICRDNGCQNSNAAQIVYGICQLVVRASTEKICARTAWVVCVIAAIGRMPATKALQHLQAKDRSDQSTSSNMILLENNSGADRRNDDPEAGESNLPMAIAPSLPPVPAKLVKQIQSGQYFELAILLETQPDVHLVKIARNVR